jgi:hypothetical protein
VYRHNMNHRIGKFHTRQHEIMQFASSMLNTMVIVKVIG